MPHEFVGTQCIRINPKAKGETMLDLLLVEPQDRSVVDHVLLVERADYGLPEFQRTFVWDDQRVLRLWESLRIGYPIGQLMFWEPDGVDFPMRAIGRDQHELSRNAKFAVIDGQQRLTAIWMVLRGEIPLRYDLQRQQFYYGRPTENSISLDILRERNLADAAAWNFFFFTATGSQQKTFAKELSTLNAVFTGRKISSQTIQHAPYPVAVNIFKRLNQQGEPLSQAQISLAGISSKWSGVFRRTFDLLKHLNDEMGFDRIEDPDFLILAWTAVHTGQHLIKHLAPDEGVKSKYTALATQEAYEQSWGKLENGVNGLIELMCDRLGLTNFQFVKAYYPLVVVINYFANRNGVSEKDKERLTQWLLMSFIQSRYSVRAQSKLREDVKATGPSGGLVNLFTHRWEPLNPDVFVLDERALAKESFRSAYTTLLYILMKKKGAVDLVCPTVLVGDPSANWHFHHLFPQENFDGERAELRNKLEDAQQNGSDEDEFVVRNEMQSLESRINTVANLAFLTPESNSSVGSRLPSDYLAEICALPGGEDRLRAQLIPLDRELWMHDAYPRFCEERRRLIAQAAKDLLSL